LMVNERGTTSSHNGPGSRPDLVEPVSPVGDHPGEHVEPAGGALRVGPAPDVVGEVELLEQRDQVGPVLLEDRALVPEVDLAHLERRESVLHGLGPGQEAALQPVRGLSRAGGRGWPAGRPRRGSPRARRSDPCRSPPAATGWGRLRTPRQCAHHTSPPEGTGRPESSASEPVPPAPPGPGGEHVGHGQPELRGERPLGRGHEQQDADGGDGKTHHDPGHAGRGAPAPHPGHQE
jgi:hypothetical protein